VRSLCVFCGSSTGNVGEHAAAARELGELLASRGIDLVYGGAQVGLMGVIADA
jgi:predicted Rossmann-fold nucleotide-binding protein